ncbi:uncharacterized protein C8R40DRAFT_749797 [Lentinula edodes]|uniref:uncharacterized protein n=1 Tax=Lentinula edodes TaxID=5353 RepID=UPI001E8E57B2|nr:uncharacterized protein C8R40DRAFT_749797 [Lentinula edodes]KAH7869274.1 hypothetical protein C8R40DRAFT_749797 [Lentinula edodes]
MLSVNVLSVSLKHICNPTTSLNTLLYHSGVSYKSSCASRLGFTEYSHRGVFFASILHTYHHVCWSNHSYLDFFIDSL